jgi:hypothetical protein
VARLGEKPLPTEICAIPVETMFPADRIHKCFKGPKGGPIGHGYSRNTITNSAAWVPALVVPVVQSSIPQILSIHLNPPGVPDDKHGAA